MDNHPFDFFKIDSSKLMDKSDKELLFQVLGMDHLVKVSGYGIIVELAKRCAKQAGIESISFEEIREERKQKTKG